MPKPGSSWRTNPPAVLGYAAAIASIALAVTLMRLFDRFWYPAPYVSVYLCAVMFSAWFGGSKPGFLAVALSALAFDYFFLTQQHSLAPALNQAPRLVLFVLATSVVALLSVMQRASAEALRKARDELAAKVQELRKINAALQKENAERSGAEALLEGQKRVLEMIATDAPLPESLKALVLLTEAQVPGMLGSILLLDDDGIHLRHGAAPNLPPEYVAAIDGRTIGPQAGSCGTAAYLKEPVIVEDIATDPRWRLYKDVALPHGLRACWSTPIFNAQHRVVGTFAMYYRQPMLPEREHLHLIEIATHAASFAIFRHCAATALRDSESKLKEAERVAHIGYWDRDLAADRITWSDETYRIFGLRSRERTFNQAALQQLIHPDDRHLQSRALAEALRGHSRYEVEYRIVRPNGEIRYVHIQDGIKLDESGRPIRIFGTVQDITERKQSEAFLHAQEQEIKAIVENSPDPITRYDRELRRTYVNPAFARVTGGSKVPLVGSKLGSTVKAGAVDATAEELEIVHTSLKRVFDSGKPLDFEAMWPTPEGRRCYTVHLEPEFDSRGACQSVLSIARDITGRKQTEETMRESQQLLQQVLATLPIGVAVTDQAGNIVLTNTASKHIWGDTIHAARERWAQSRGFWHDSGARISPEEWPSVRALTKGETSVNELIDIETFDGQHKIILNSTAPIRNTEDVIVGAVIINEDVTESKKSEQKLRQTETELARVARLTMMGELTASIAHEVNQPLAAVVTNAEAASRWLSATPPNLDEAREAIRRIGRDGNRASVVIARIRSLMKKSEPARTLLDLNALIQETIVLAQPEITRKKVSLQIELASGLPRVPADRVQLQQVLLNLVVNALDSLGEVADRPRLLRIRTEHLEADTVQITVQDAGIGIKPQETERLFEAFYTTKEQGLGMGLAISRSIVEAHGGRLWATSNDGHGATFQFILPLQEGGAQ